MNAILINERFKQMKSYENLMNYQYEPRFPKKYNNWRRHIYYKDCKEDFIEDLTMFGFSPFISKTYKDQKNDLMIMRFKPKTFNHGLMNYVKRKYVTNESQRICSTDRLCLEKKTKKKLFLSDALKLIDIQRNIAMNKEDEMKTNESLPNQQHEDKNEHIKTAATNVTDNLLNNTVTPKNHIEKKEPLPKLKLGLEKGRKFQFYNSNVYKDYQSNKEIMTSKQGHSTAYENFTKLKDGSKNTSQLRNNNNSTSVSKLKTKKSTTFINTRNIEKKGQSKFIDIGSTNLFDKAKKIQKRRNNLSC